MKVRILLLALTLILTLVTAGCASSPPESKYFLLRTDIKTISPSAENAPAIGWGRVSVASYLDRAGIVVQVADNQVREAQYHLWAEPLNRGIWHYVGAQTSNELGYSLSVNEAQKSQWDSRVDLRVDEFHGTLDGRAHLVASWSVTDLKGQGKVKRYEFSQTQVQVSDGYASLVDAQIKLLDQLAKAIASSLR